MIKFLEKNLIEVFKLPLPAVEWLIMFWGAIQVFDDIADSQPVAREDLDNVIWNSLVAMHSNEFFIKNSELLLPVITTTILKWQAADMAERAAQADARSFVWRAGYYDIVLMVVLIVHGPKTAQKSSHLVMNLYGENFDDYIKEFNKNA